MKKLLMFILFTIILSNTNDLYSQSDTIYKPGWTPRGVMTAGLTQVALSNWSKGGENVFALTGVSDFGINYRKNKWVLKNSLLATIGSTKTGSGSFQTNDNSAALETVLLYLVGWSVSPFISNEFRTGILNGYDYSGSSPLQTSAFFDPGYITQSIGFTFDRRNFTTRLGLAFQETFTNKFRQYSDDIGTSNVQEAFKFQTGIESVTETNLSVMENFLYTGRFRLFSAFNQLDVWDVGWDNTLTAKVNDLIAVNLNFILVYEKSQSLKTQVKEGLNLGFTYAVF
jgi:hypothetical protein